MRQRALLLAMEQLTTREQEVIRARWLDESNEKGATLHKLASCFGVSAERIRQIEKAAMRKIKAHLESHHIHNAE